MTLKTFSSLMTYSKLIAIFLAFAKMSIVALVTFISLYLIESVIIPQYVWERNQVEEKEDDEQ